MPRSEKSSRALATTFSSWKRSTAAKTGVLLVEWGAGLAVCATTQIEQEADSAWLGWWWVDSAAAVQNIKDRQSHADHRIHNRMNLLLRG
jgi:hypothetical protein